MTRTLTVALTLELRREVTVMMEVPSLRAVTRPVSLTEATVLTPEAYLTDVSAVAGVMVWVNCRVSPNTTVTVPVWPSAILVGFKGSTTLILTLALTLAFRRLVRVMVAVPSFWAVTRPVSSTAATALLDVAYLQVLSAVAGAAVWVICRGVPMYTTVVPV